MTNMFKFEHSKNMHTHTHTHINRNVLHSPWSIRVLPLQNPFTTLTVLYLYNYVLLDDFTKFIEFLLTSCE